MSYCLITGGAGYIGSHIVEKIITKEIKFIVLDNLCNSSLKNLKLLQDHYKLKIIFKKIDINDEHELNKLFCDYEIESVIHLAGLKSISESINYPEKYIENNVNGSKKLFSIMIDNSCYKLIFSSSASVYGQPTYLPINEAHSLNPLNAYAFSKLQIEKLILDIKKNNDKFSCLILRYFNPLGSFKGIIGEEFNFKATNIMPSLLKSISNKNHKFYIYGNDFNTPDNFAIRDYIHVEDLAIAHIEALKKLQTFSGVEILNIGTGNGYSVMQLLDTFSEVNNIKINYEIVPRREFEVDCIYACPKKIKNFLGWKSKKTLDDMCRDSFNYFVKNKWPLKKH